MKHQTKINKKLSSLDKSDVKLNKQRQAQMKSGQIKEAKYRSQAARLRQKKYGLFTSKKKADKLEYKAGKLENKADIIRSKIDMTKAKLDKNSAKRDSYNKGLATVNSYLEKNKKKKAS